jgi:hypothetical protein
LLVLLLVERRIGPRIVGIVLLHRIRASEAWLRQSAESSKRLAALVWHTHTTLTHTLSKWLEGLVALIMEGLIAWPSKGVTLSGLPKRWLTKSGLRQRFSRSSIKLWGLSGLRLRGLSRLSRLA